MDGDITLNAVNNITLKNRVEAGVDGRNNISLYSAQGLVLQTNAVASLGDGVSGEALVADALTVRAASGIDLRFLDVVQVQASNTQSNETAGLWQSLRLRLVLARLRGAIRGAGRPLRPVAGQPCPPGA